MHKNVDFFDKSYLIEMLDNLSKATGLYIEAVNIFGGSFLEGREVKKSNFCTYVQKTKEGTAMCQKSYQKACQEAFKWNEPYFFRCHAGLVMWCVPITIDEVNVGAIISGQVLLWKPDKFFFKELEQFNKYVDDLDTLKEYAKMLNVISPDKSQSVANMLSVVVKYLARVNNYTFLEQKNIVHWRNTLINQVENRKKELSKDKFDYDTYLKREKRLLQYIRLANKEMIVNLIPTIFTDIDTLCKYELDEIKMMSVELMSLISRAASEAGVQSDICIKIIRKFQSEIKLYKRSEEVFSSLNNNILSLLDMAYVLVNNNHVSVLKSAREYIDNNYYKKITIEEISEHVFMSTSYLCYLFKTKLNCTVNDYITRVRIEKSIELMKKRELSVGEIMNKVGFSSQSHFTKTFKKVIGVTPGNYRNKFL